MTQAKVTDAPKKFCEFLTKKAREANKRIVLPEGNEPRTVKAANICAEEGIATPVLLGKREEMYFHHIQKIIIFSHADWLWS